MTYNPQQSYTPAPQQTSGGSLNLGFFSGLIDFSFSRFVTIKFAQFFYMISVVFNIAVWLLVTIAMFIAMPIVGLLWLLFGWLFALLSIAVSRVLIELTVASIRTAQNTTALLENAESRS